MLGHVLHCTTSSEVWKTLDLLFSTKSKARLLHVRFLLQTTKKGTMSIEDYVLKMKSFAHELMSAGQLIPDDELALYILGGLGPKHESVTVNLTSKDSVTLLESQFMLQAHELRLENFNASSVMEVSHATANLTLSNNVSGSVRPANYQSHSSSGTSFSNPRRRGARGRSNYGGRGFQGSSFKLLCQICGRNCHSAAKCYHIFDLSYAGTGTQAYNGTSSSAMETVQHSQAHIATPSALRDDAWYLDSGATHHTTPISESLESKSEYHGFSKLLVGNGSALPITHVD